MENYKEFFNGYFHLKFFKMFYLKLNIKKWITHNIIIRSPFILNLQKINWFIKVHQWVRLNIVNTIQYTINWKYTLIIIRIIYNTNHINVVLKMLCLQKFLNPLRPYCVSPRSAMRKILFEKKYRAFIQRKIEIKQSRKRGIFYGFFQIELLL